MNLEQISPVWGRINDMVVERGEGTTSCRASARRSRGWW